MKAATPARSLLRRRSSVPGLERQFAASLRLGGHGSGYDASPYAGIASPSRLPSYEHSAVYLVLAHMDRADGMLAVADDAACVLCTSYTMHPASCSDRRILESSPIG